MKQNEFILKANKALNAHTVYGSGAFGASIGNFADQRERYRKNTLSKCGEYYANKLVSEATKKPCFAFDCCGLVKGLIWGWNENANSVYGGAVYESNGLPDLGAGGGTNDLISYCNNVSNDFTTIIPGEMLWIDGHVGIYIGDGYAIECTTAWKDGVQKTVVTNIRPTKSGEYGRRWTKHGRLPWVEYSEKPTIICPCCGAKFALI